MRSSIVCSVAICVAACSSSAGRKAPDGGTQCGAATTGDGTFASVTPIVVRTCARTGCHDPVQHEHGMDLSTPELIYGNWVNKKGLDHCANQAVFRVAPGDPDGSFVMKKIRAAGALCSLGTRMPPPPMDMLSACEIATIQSWIAARAPGPAGAGDGGSADAEPDVAADAADDGSTDASPDAPDPDPGSCTASTPCEPLNEVCVETAPVTTGGNCYTRWECYAHAPPDDTLKHPCPPETAVFCACDGSTFEISYGCPNLPYEHIGACGDGYTCNVDRVRCSDPAPTCPDGQAPAVVAGCWGPCVPITMCRCDQTWQCPAGNRCIFYPTFRCGPWDAGSD